MTTYTHLTQPWQDFLDLVQQDTQAALIDTVLDQVAERSRVPPHSVKPPKSDELIELVRELMDYTGIHRDLSDAWTATSG